jgi:GT2 family glycosyltransferase
LLFLDDDCIPEPGWADAFLRSAGSGRFDVIEGKTFCPDPSDDPFEERVENLFGGLLWSCNLAIRRDAFEALGGFDEEFLEAGGEDMEFAWRIRKAGLRVGFEPGAAVAHPARRGGWRLLWRRTWMIRWIALFDRKTGGTTGKGVFGAWVWRTKMEVLRLLREGWREIAGLRREEWRRPVFGFLVRIVMFPVVLPYLLYWEWRFRERGSIQVERD